MGRKAVTINTQNSAGAPAEETRQQFMSKVFGPRGVAMYQTTFDTLNARSGGALPCGCSSNPARSTAASSSTARYETVPDEHILKAMLISRAPAVA